MIRKQSIQGCNKAWRYSEPVLEPPPPRGEEEHSADSSSEDHLLGFYDLLAMIQAPCFMLRYSQSAIVSVSDAEMRFLEWLHEEIRNDFEHFIPRTLLASSDDCLCASETCLRLAIDLLTKSQNIMPYGIDDLPTALHAASAAVSAFRARLHVG